MTGGQLNGVLRYLRRFAAGRGPAAASDGQLLERFNLRQDESAFEALLGRHGPMVLGVCHRLLHRPEDVEDAFQATFLVLACRARAVVKRESVGSWLYGVAYRIALRARACAARCTFAGLIPGATYRFGHAEIEATIRAEAGKDVDLGDITVK
jgi:DNA-directed RNA polymerase specialized sigma24 family protein